ncbi:hypothetical protein PR048_027038 [Dryococelus australis]|uniref:DUF4371 domain-containing protein n=1 Tax=Dryococelus australis TaxID=614101 RepID=A0ABQ9GEA9_9NEOP|nr:hypothetical protein PR048_027038 [Dryococelus australis]
MKICGGDSVSVNTTSAGVSELLQDTNQRMAQVEENKQCLIPIVKTIILCGKQNIPLRGHRDDKNIGNLLNGDEKNSIVNNDGNFRQLLQFRMDAGDNNLCRQLLQFRMDAGDNNLCRQLLQFRMDAGDNNLCRQLLQFRMDAGDNNLCRHWKNAPSNATYISKHTQNELIKCCKEDIQIEYIFAIPPSHVPREDFITFLNAYNMIQEEDIKSKGGERRLSGIALGHIIEDIAKNFDLVLKFCVRFGIDSCSVMASETKGAIQELKKITTHAQRCPCNNHTLNNSLANTLKVVSCRNTSGTINKIVSFANASPKRRKWKLLFKVFAKATRDIFSSNGNPLL